MLENRILQSLTPKHMPRLSEVLSDLGRPKATVIAKTFDVSRSSVHRWIAADEAPRAVVLALHLMTHQGKHAVGEHHFRGELLAHQHIQSLEREKEKLVREFARVVAAADFGCANDVFSQPVAWEIERERLRRPLKLAQAQ